jgi:hypothetical protein
MRALTLRALVWTALGIASAEVIVLMVTAVLTSGEAHSLFADRTLLVAAIIGVLWMALVTFGLIKYRWRGLWLVVSVPYALLWLMVLFSI